jgi:hypothetical protein
MNTDLQKLNKEAITKSLVVVLLTLVVCYSVTLLSLTGNAISLKKLSLQVKKTSVQIVKVERSYSQLLSSIDASHIKKDRFQVVSNSSFVVKKDDIAAFSVLYER